MGIHIRILAGHVGLGVGSHVYHYELAKRLARRGHRVSIVCFSSTPTVRDYADVYEIPLGDYASKAFVWRSAALFQYKHLSRELLKLKLKPADVAIAGEHLFLRGFRKKFPETPVIYVPHAPVAPKEILRYNLPPTMLWITSTLYSHLQRWALNNADRTLRFTKVGCEILKRYYGESIRPRFVVNPAGVETPPLRSVDGTGEGIRLLSIGRLVSWKRIDLALSALAGLRQYRWRFDVVGEGEARPTLERQATELGLNGRVRFHGFQPQISEWYDRADVFLFPSELEGFGFVVLEAMSHGIPCIAIRADHVNYWNANAEIITNGKNGILCDGEDDFGRQLEIILRKPQQLTALGVAARARVAECFTWEKHLARYEELFDEIIQERRGTRDRSYEQRTRRSTVTPKHSAFPAVQHVLASRELGGAGLIALALARDCLKRSGECQVWIPGDGPASTQADQLNLTWRRYDIEQLFSKAKIAAFNSNWQFYFACRAAKPSLIHVHSPFIYGAMRVGLKAAGIKRVVHVQLEEDRDGLRWAFKYPPDLIITCAQYLADYVRQCLPKKYAETQRIVAVPNSVDTEVFFPGDKAATKRRLGAPADVPLLLGIGNLSPHKGHETIIRTVANLRARGISVACWIAGAERGNEVTYTNRLDALITELKLDDRVKLLGFRSDTNALLRAADFLLLPSSHEGLPICVLEAQASKVPVLAAATAGIPEVITDGKTGFLIAPSDFDRYSKTVEMLLKEKRLYDEVSENGYQQIIRDYARKDYCNRIWELYLDMFNPQGKTQAQVIH